MQRRTIAALLVLVLTACGHGDPETAPPGRPAPSLPLEGAAQPLPSPARTPVDPGGDPTDSRVIPVSGPAEPGVLYTFVLYTHCGIDYWASWDFDGSFWDVAAPSASDPRVGELSNPEDHGTIELTSTDSARYTASNGLVIDLTRSADTERRGVMCA